MTQRPPLKTPTARQRKAAQLVSENLKADKPRSVAELLEEAGYSKSMALRSTEVTRSQGFLAVLEAAGVTDDKLAIVLNDGLEAEDLNTRHKYLETGLRLKGHGKADNISVTFNSAAQVQRNEYNLS